MNEQGKGEKEKRKWPTAPLLCVAIMLSGQLAINQGAELSGPLIAPEKKVAAEVERPSEREEVQGAHGIATQIPVSRVIYSRFFWEIFASVDFSNRPRAFGGLKTPMP